MSIATKMFQIENYRYIIEEFIPFQKNLGFRLLKMEEGHASILVPYESYMVGDPRTKRIHGGIISTAMDAVGGAAAMTTLGSAEDQISTIDMRIDYLNPGQAEDIVVEGFIVRNGGSVVFTRMVAHNKDSDIAIAEGRANYRVKRT